MAEARVFKFVAFTLQWANLINRLNVFGENQIQITVLCEIINICESLQIIKK